MIFFPKLKQKYLWKMSAYPEFIFRFQQPLNANIYFSCIMSHKLRN